MFSRVSPSKKGFCILFDPFFPPKSPSVGSFIRDPEFLRPSCHCIGVQPRKAPHALRKPLLVRGNRAARWWGHRAAQKKVGAFGLRIEETIWPQWPMCQKINSKIDQNRRFEAFRPRYVDVGPVEALVHVLSIHVRCWGLVPVLRVPTWSQ